MADPFRSAWLKLGWGVLHSYALYEEIRAYVAQLKPGDHFTTRTEYDAKAHCVKLVVDTVSPTPDVWSLRLGDVVNNFRASLDHVAWQLVRRGTAWPLNKGREKNVYFPIADSCEAFDERCKANLPGLLRRDKALIRLVQPYAGGKRNMWRHCLTPLPKMTSDDKHRELRPVWSAPEQGKIEHVIPPRDCEITRVPQVAKRIILNPDEEISRVYVRKTGPHPDIQMKSSMTVKPIVDGPIWLDDWLAKTPEHITALLRALSQGPPEEFWDWGIMATPR
jgi:hypothetical protein